MNARKCQTCKGKLNRRNKKYCSVRCRVDDPEYWDKVKKTNISKYGVENPFQSEKIKQKLRQISLKKYGTEYPIQSKKIKDKITASNIKKYGAPNPFQNEIVKKKIKETILRKYGVDVISKSEVIKNKMAATNFSKYGVRNFKHLLIPPESLRFLENKDWMTEQHIVLKRTLSAIARELNVTDVTVKNYCVKHGIDISYWQNRYSRIGTEWLNLIAKKHHIFIRHSENIGEYRIPKTKYYVDGYCNETNTVYEFYGDAWHGNLNIFKEEDKCHPFIRNITALELHNRTIKRENTIRSLGYNIVTIWENEAKAILDKYTGAT